MCRHVINHRHQDKRDDNVPLLSSKYNYQACPPMLISGLSFALLSGLDAETEHYMNYSTARLLLNTCEDILNISSSELEGKISSTMLQRRWALTP